MDPFTRTKFDEDDYEPPGSFFCSFGVPEESLNEMFFPIKPPNKRTLYSVALSPNLVSGAPVMVNFEWSQRKLHISAYEDEPSIECLINEIEDYVPNAPRLTRTPDLDEIVLAPYDDSYYRAVVQAVLKNKVYVQFLDYGDEAVVHQSQLVELNPEINLHPIYGVTLLVENIPEELPNIDSQRLEQILRAGGYVSVEKMERFTWTGDIQMLILDKRWSQLVIAKTKDVLQKRADGRQPLDRLSR